MNVPVSGMKCGASGRVARTIVSASGTAKHVPAQFDVTRSIGRRGRKNSGQPQGPPAVFLLKG